VVKFNSSSTITNSSIFDNGSSVGIGTTSPTTLFQLRQATASHQIFSINRANSETSAIYIGNDSSSNAIIASNNTALRFGKDFTGTFNEYVRIDTAGNVGIGTSNPSALLTLYGTYPQLVLNNPSAGSGCVIQLKDAGTNRGAIGHFTLTSGLQFSSAGQTPQMTLDSNGNLGIGINGPSRKLDIRKSTSGEAFLSYHTGGNGTVSAGIDLNEIRSDDTTTAYNLLNINVAGISKFLVTSAGNVGIGTSSPLEGITFGSSNSIIARSSATDFNSGYCSRILFNQGGTGYGYLGFYTYEGGSGGGERVRISESGNVGIGTTSATSKLTILQSSGADSVLLELQSNNDPGIRFGRSTYGSLIRHVSATTDYIAFNCNGSSKPSVSATAQVVFNENGNVGIGTDSPTSKLHVVGNAQLYGTNGGNININTAASGNGDISFDGSTFTIVSNSSSASLVLSTNSTERFRIISGGNVGIGTTSPGAKLDIRQTSAATGLKVFTNDTSTAYIAQFVGYDNSLGDTTRMVVQAGGNVGIGSTSPAAKLDVVGNIQTEGLLGKAYSASGGATIDTGITADTFTVLEVVGYANPNSGGSSAYKDPIHIFIYNGAGWNGSALTQYIYSNQLAPLAREVYTSGSSSSANVIDVVWLTGSTESDSCPAATASSYQVRLKVSNYNSTYGSYFNVRIIKRY
jgi:hypothetical protein